MISAYKVIRHAMRLACSEDRASRCQFGQTCVEVFDGTDRAGGGQASRVGGTTVEVPEACKTQEWNAPAGVGTCDTHHADRDV